MRICGTLLRNQRIVIFGAGLAGIGIADLIRDVMISEGLSAEDATRRFWCVDVHGLLTSDMGDRLHDYQATYARPAAEVKSWRRESADAKAIGLAEVIRQVRPTMLIGTSGIAGAFTEAIVRDMARHTERPIIFPLSSPACARRGHSRRSDRLDRWAGLDRHRQPVHAGHSQGNHPRHRPGEQRHVVPRPGPGYDCVPSPPDQRRHARGRGQRVVQPGRRPAAGRVLLPHIDDLRSVTVTVAVAVAEAAVAEGLATVKLADIVQQVEDAMWQPEYRRIQAS